MVKTVDITKYLAKDGAEFDNKKDAVLYDALENVAEVPLTTLVRRILGAFTPYTRTMYTNKYKTMRTVKVYGELSDAEKDAIRAYFDIRGQILGASLVEDVDYSFDVSVTPGFPYGTKNIAGIVRLPYTESHAR